MKQIHVAAAIICKEGKILATQRGYGTWSGWWELPGGKVEAGETPEEALRREIREELAADIHIEQHAITIDYDYPDTHLHMDCFLCRLASDFTLIEHQAAQWVATDRIDSLQWLPADKELFQHWTPPSV